MLVFSVVVHETAHGQRPRLRDRTALERGRLTLNPLPHLSLMGSIVMPGLLLLARSPFVFGWAKPVPVDPARFRDPRNDVVAVALAGPCSNFLLAFGFAALARVAPEAGWLSPLSLLGYAGVAVNVVLGLVNLIPLPPLDGSWVLMRFLRMRHILVLHQFRLLGLLVVALLVCTPFTSRVLVGAPVNFVMSARRRSVGRQGPSEAADPSGMRPGRSCGASSARNWCGKERGGEPMVADWLC